MRFSLPSYSRPSISKVFKSMFCSFPSAISICSSLLCCESFCNMFRLLWAPVQSF
ncbi:Uncharacterized protein TCM_030936 [Theobroma cacao]|uniref:Uncharacterized protein n=1 Tax=Theobroma cacao TaxID=3641 RepID=A0A061F4X9_THECC|nr:Uncharacterized protein TCM_030936 [Theobroma cacao]